MELKIEVLDRKSTGVASLLESLLVDEYVLSVRTSEASPQTAKGEKRNYGTRRNHSKTKLA